jgi:ATP-binding protein involved in chromosome partitioning
LDYSWLILPASVEKDMNENAVNIIEAVEPIEECGRGHACSFCPIEESCKLDQSHHSKVHIEQRLAKINWVIPVLANKGGVGKSTVSANLAVALAQQGYAVGLADADIHGPNAARLFGLQDERVKVSGRGVHAPSYKTEGRGSLRVGSLAFFLESSDTPVVWRDAYKHDYIHHMLGSFDWGVLDFLIVDMPPGTGNELITLADVLKGCNTSALLVSTADAIALQDTLKAARYCKDTALPILGLVENHAGVVCPHCGGEFEMFPRAPEVDQFAEMDIRTLARIPFTPEIGTGAAAGRPAAGDSDSALHPLFSELAKTCSDQLITQQRTMMK